MSSTRKAADPTAPISQERYMSSPEFFLLRGISATATAARTALIDDPKTRSLLWWIQAKSLEEGGGTNRFAREFLARSKDRIGTPSMRRFGMKPGQVYNADQVRAVRPEVNERAFPLRGESWDYVGNSFAPVEGLYEPSERDIKQSTEHPTSYPASAFVEALGDLEEKLVSFFVDICINPRLELWPSKNPARGARAEKTEYEHRLKDEFPGDRLWTKQAELPWFNDVLGALQNYKAEQEKAALENFELTAIGRKIWATLDFALTTRNMVLIDGEQGRGKTEASKAWCALHKGEARFVTLKGINNKTSAFREIAKALGIAGGTGYKSTELQARVEDVLQRSKLLLIIDEAHFIFNQGQRIYTRPELADWIHTLSNRRIPIALVTTPQFMVCLTRANMHVDWNYRQFRRRVRRYEKLPEKNTPRDIEAVIRRVLPGAPNSAVKQVLAYVRLSKRDLSAVGDVVDEIKAMQGVENITKASYDEIFKAIDDYLVPSEKNFVESITNAEKRLSKKRSKRAQATGSEPQAEIDTEAMDTEEPACELERETMPPGAGESNRIVSDRSGVAPRTVGNLIAV